MPLTAQEQSTFHRLHRMHATAQQNAKLLDGYYRGVQRLAQLGLAVPPELRGFVTVVNWPRVAVDAVEERLDVEGFRYPGAARSDDDLWRIWQENNLDEESQQAHVEALALRRSYVSIGTNERDEGTPIITIESPREMVAERDTRTREVVGALKLYSSEQLEDGRENVADRATLYLPEGTVWLRNDRTGWIVEDRDPHRLGRVPVVPLVNRPRVGDWLGTSEMDDVIPLTDAAARALTNLQLAQETHAVPQRWVLGASKGDFVDSNGDMLPTWEAYFGAIWALQNKDAKAGQFSASDLRNFHDTVNHYAHLASSVSGLPLRFFGQNTANPPSADGIRADETRLVKRCERKQKVFSGAWEEAMRIADRLRTGEWNPKLRRLETVWRDPSTPTVAAVADAVVKQHAQGIIPTELAWDELGWSEEKKRRARELRAAELSDPLIDSVLTPDVSAADPAELKAKADAMGVLIRSGVDPANAAAQVGLAGVKFTGAVPVSLRQPESEASRLED